MISNFVELKTTAQLFSDGDWVESKDQDKAGSVRLIQLADVGDGNFINKSHRFMNIETAKRLNCTFLNKDDILIARMPDPLGRCCLFPFDEDEKYVTVVDVTIFRVKYEYSKKYLQYVINTSQIRHVINGQVTGTTRKRITKKKLSAIKIPLPPLAEQQKIAAILDAADSLRQKDQQLIDHYTTLSQSLFLEMFGDPVTNPMGWEKGILADIAKKITDGTHKTPKYVGDGVTFISAKNIKNNEIVFNQVKHITLEEHNLLIRRCKVERGDILITKSGSIGMAGIVNVDTIFSIFESLALIKYSRDEINGLFLLYFMNNPGTRLQYSRHTKGVGVKHLHLTDLRKIKIILPNLKLQEQFSDRIKAIESQKQQAQASLEKSNNLFNSLLQKAFKGELTSSKAA